MYCAVGHGGQLWLYLPTIASRPAGCTADEADSAQARSDRKRRRGWSEGTEPVTRDGEGRADGAVSMKLNHIFRFLKSDSLQL